LAFGPQNPTKRIYLIIKYSATHFATVLKFGKLVHSGPSETHNTFLQKKTLSYSLSLKNIKMPLHTSKSIHTSTNICEADNETQNPSEFHFYSVSSTYNMN